MADALKLDLSRHTNAFARMAATSKKPLVQLWREEARICFGGSRNMPGVAGITPPYGEGKLQNANAAAAHARGKVASDILSWYGTPNDAYQAVHENAPGEAQAFWYLFKHNDIGGANDIVKQNTKGIFYPFDGGKLHRRNFRKRSGGGRHFRFYVSDPKALKDYIKMEQDHIWWLASGWADPLQALGATLPPGIKKHPAPGHIEIVINEQTLSVTIGNDVKYAGQIKDMQRRISTVMNDWRVARLDRMWKSYCDKLARDNGFTSR